MPSRAITWAPPPRTSPPLAADPRRAGPVRRGVQNKAEAAEGGKFKDEIIAVTVKTRKGDIVVDADEYPRHGSTMDAMGKLKPAFSKDGTVTAGNASGINDGAAAAVLMSEAKPPAVAWPPLARIRVLGHLRRRSRHHGHRPDPGPRAARWKRRAGKSPISTSSRRLKPSPPRRWRSTRIWAGIRPS